MPTTVPNPGQRPSRPRGPRRARSRRVAVLGSLTVWVCVATSAVSGCSVDGVRVQVPGSSAESPGADASAPPAVRGGDTSRDEALAARLSGRLGAVLALTTATTRRHPALGERLAPLAADLRADRRVVQEAGQQNGQQTGQQTGSSTPAFGRRRVPADQSAALQAVTARAVSLRGQLRTDALSALSGRFARLIGSMAAALGQRLDPLRSQPLLSTVPSLSATPPTAYDGPSPLQTALAGEHAAVWVYSVLGAQTSQSSAPESYERLLAAYTWHREARDRLVGALRARGESPVAAAPSYELPNAVASAAEVTAAALVTERRVSAVEGRLVQGTVAGDRAWALTLLEQSTLRQLRFGGAPQTFPGTTQ